MYLRGWCIERVLGWLTGVTKKNSDVTKSEASENTSGDLSSGVDQ